MLSYFVGLGPVGFEVVEACWSMPDYIAPPLVDLPSLFTVLVFSLGVAHMFTTGSGEVSLGCSSFLSGEAISFFTGCFSTYCQVELSFSLVAD